MNKKISKLSFCAILITISFVLSKIQIVPMPLGGAVTLFSMLFISLPGYFLGLKYGFMSAFSFAILKLIFGGYVVSIAQGMLDYVFAYLSFGITGIFYKSNNKYSLILSYSVAVILRYIFTCISGYVFFADYAPKAMNPVIYTLLYNGGYMFTEMIITIFVLIIPFVHNIIFDLKNKVK